MPSKHWITAKKCEFQNLGCFGSLVLAGMCEKQSESLFSAFWLLGFHFPIFSQVTGECKCGRGWANSLRKTIVWFWCCGPQTSERSKQFECVAGGVEQSRSRVITAPCICDHADGHTTFYLVTLGSMKMKRKRNKDERILHEDETMSLKWQIKLNLLR